MAKSDIITRAKIESDQWTRGMRGMQADLDKFRSKSKGMTSEGAAMNKMFGSITSGLGKFAGALGVGLTAMEAFNRTIAASEQLTDLMGATMQQANSIVDAFFASIATADFSNFVNGLGDITRGAREAYEAVDALGTLKMFQSPQAARIQADIAEQREILRNPNASSAQKEAAKVRLEQLTGEMKQMSTQLQKQALEAFKTSIRDALRRQGAANVPDAYIDQFVRENLGSMDAFQAMQERLSRYEGTIQRLQQRTPKYATRNGRQVYIETPNYALIADERDYTDEIGITPLSRLIRETNDPALDTLISTNERTVRVQIIHPDTNVVDQYELSLENGLVLTETSAYEGEIFRKHISPNAMIYLVHGIPGTILGCLTGAIITERVYAMPGVGNLLTAAINGHDNGIIVAVTMFYTTLTIISIILGDLLLAKYDPRISLTSSKGGGR